jgi:energy-coupling factor transporter ATP-binding protein EcfA2
MMETNHWLSRFPVALSDAKLAARVRIPGVRPDGLGTNSPEVDSALVEQAMAKVFEPTPSLIKHLRGLLDLAQGHAAIFFPSIKSYQSRLYELKPSTQPAVCLTGHAGVGKSCLLDAFSRLVQQPPPKELVEATGSPVENCWLLRLSALEDLKDRLKRLAFGLPAEEGKEGEVATSEQTGTIANLAQAASRRARRLALCLLVLDEMQFETLSWEANTRITKILQLFLAFGPRLIYCLNYSMGHRLMRRHMEDCDRLIASPIIVMPDPANSEDWRQTLRAIFAVAPDAFRFDVEKVATTLHWYTFGIKRKLVTLLTHAYRIARRAGRHQVSMEDVLSAYRSMEFTTHRQDVELLISQDIEGIAKRPDLSCPFPDALPLPNPGPPPPEGDPIPKEIARQALLASMTPTERAGAEAAQRDADAPPPPQRNNVVRMPRPTKDALLAGAKSFLQSSGVESPRDS